MKISKIHEKLGGGSFDHEKALGPNWQTVFNFWLFFDELSSEQLASLETSFNCNEQTGQFHGYMSELARRCSGVIFNEEYLWINVASVASPKSCFFTDASIFIAWITHEIIAIHEIVKDGKEPLFMMLFNETLEKLSQPQLPETQD